MSVDTHDNKSSTTEKSDGSSETLNNAADPAALAASCTLESAEPEEEQDVEAQAAKEAGLTTTISRTTTGPPYSIFSKRTKLFILVMVSFSSLISPFGATTFYPSLDVLAKDLNVTPSLINLSLTTYMIAQAIAPALIAGMSDLNGRRPSYIICFVIYILANIGLALQTNYAALLVLRMVQAFGCSAAIALATAIVADIATSAERGTYMGYASAGLLFGPAFGPTIGGLLAQYLGWRSTFWFLAIYTAVLAVLFTSLFPETCRNVVGNGSIPAKGLSQSLLGYLQQRKHRKEREAAGEEDDSASTFPPTQKKRFPNPLATLKILGEKESCIILLYNGLFFTGMMVVTAAIPTLYQQKYHLNTVQTGLCYIPQGIGSLVAALLMGRLVDWNFRRHARRLGFEIRKGKQQDLANFPVELVRFQIVVPGHVIGTLFFIVFGWTVEYRTSLAGPEIALFFIGFGTSTAFNITNTLLIDLHRDKPATATAAVNFCRCLMSAGGAAFIIPMCNALGAGWAFTIIAFVYVLLIGAVFLLMYRGQKWRMELAEKKAAQAQREAEREMAALEEV